MVALWASVSSCASPLRSPSGSRLWEWWRTNAWPRWRNLAANRPTLPMVIGITGRLPPGLSARRAIQFILARTHAAGRFVQRDVNQFFRADEFPIHRHLVVVGINFRPQQPDGLAVDLDAPLQNNLLARTAGSHAGISEKFLQTNHSK